jgi:hypothetical protein
VSIYHTTNTVDTDLLAAPLGKMQAAATAIGSTIRAALLRHSTQHHLTDLSDHMLSDFGFERDWDGTVLRLRKAD